MTDGQRRGDEGQTTILVEVTPSDYRRRAAAFTGIGLGATILALVLAVQTDGSANFLLPVAAVGYGIYCAVLARRRVTATLVRIDASGLRSADGLHDHTWDGVVMVWVGSWSGLRLPLVRQPVVSVFTGAGVEFAERVGMRAQPRYTLPVGGPMSVSELCGRLSRMSSVSVLDGTQISRRAAAASLSR